MAGITLYTKAQLDTIVAALVAKPSGGTDGQALIKSGSSVIWGAGGGGGGNVSVVDNGDGTFTASGAAVTANSDGTYTIAG